MRSALRGPRIQWWLVPALAALLAFSRWSGARGGPVRICDLPGNPLVVQGGRIVFARHDSDRASTLVVQPARGGPARTIALAPGHSAQGAQVTATHLVYLTSAGPNDSKSPAARRRSAEARVTEVHAYELHRVPWSGGDSEVVRFEGEAGGVLTKEGCYWWGRRDADEVRPLRFLPLSGGEARTIGGGEGMVLGASENGGPVVTTPSAAGVTRRQSSQIRGSGPIVEFLRDAPSPAGGVSLGERRYWVEHDLRSRPGSEPHPDRIMSARADGSDRKILLEAESRAVQFGQLLAHGEALFVGLTEPDPGRTVEGKSVRLNTLCRIRPDDASAPKRICAIPGQNGICYLDGEDVYFAVMEDREKWWDWSSSGLIPRRVTAWYHYRMPAG